jgi:hypothetical protein
MDRVTDYGSPIPDANPNPNYREHLTAAFLAIPRLDDQPFRSLAKLAWETCDSGLDELSQERSF